MLYNVYKDVKYTMEVNKKKKRKITPTVLAEKLRVFRKNINHIYAIDMEHLAED